jgi:hypothetical protein
MFGIHFGSDIVGSKHNVILAHMMTGGCGNAQEMGQDSQYDAGACSYVTEISTAD